MKAKACCENRALTPEEELILRVLRQKSIAGYNNAFEDSMKMDDKKLRVGVYGVLIKENMVLMTRTKSGSRWIYNFPGGGIDFDEGLCEALVRECKEELDADVIVRNEIYTTKKLYTHSDFPNYYMFNLYYMIDLKNKKIIDAADTKWFSIENLPLDEMLEIDKEFILQNLHSLL